MKDSANLLEINEKLLIQEVNKIRKRSYNQRQQRPSQSRPSRDSKEEQPTAIESAKDETTAPISARRARIYNFEQEIIRYIVRYGMNFIFQRYEKQKKGEGKQTKEVDVLVEEGSTVIEFVYSDLERDNIKITNPLYSQMFEEAYRESENRDFQPAKYFISHSDSNISKCATDMLNDKYQLSKIHAKSLGEEIDDEKSRLLEENLLEILIPRVTTELKNVYILKQIERVMRKIKEAERKNDFETTLKLLEEKRKLEEIKKILAKMLGEQVIIRY